MKLEKFKVTNFRSVKDSGWITTDDVTTLVGINESGKTNILLALWKLHPARGGEIKAIEDLPLSVYSEKKSKLEEVKFIEAIFLLSDETKQELADERGKNQAPISKITISRFYNGNYEININDEETPSSDPSLCNLILTKVPQFIYYSNYGNLSGKIYLQNAITWLEGKEITGIPRNEDQIRSLKVLFEFVNLDPKEIQELGQRTLQTNHNKEQAQATIEKNHEKTDERHALLKSASVNLTKKFRAWWKQGNHKFNLHADGDYLNIYVSDELRQDDVPLHLRSTGLQWFLSFLLIFLVESKNSHKHCILLLDEAGLTLHPHAQKDLAAFFESLSKSNQIIHTTHSPFIVNVAHIDRCRAVSIDKNGYTYVSSDLRNTGNDKLLKQSIYSLHAAIGISTSEVLLHGCKSIIVEGCSDQYILNAIKLYLVSIGKLSPKNEIVFMPSGGVKNIKPIVSIIGGIKEQLPHVIIDSDEAGRKFKCKLEQDLYKDDKELILEVGDFIHIDNAEIEDLIPKDIIQSIADSIINSSSEIFIEDYDGIELTDNIPVLQQIEAHAKNYSVSLVSGFKVEIAKKFKATLAKKASGQIDEQYIDIWVQLFDKLTR